MPLISTPLTDTKIKAAKPKDKEYNLSDGSGLFVRVMPNGKKRFLFNYVKPLSKSRTNIGFGAYPETTLAQARQKRAEARSLLAQKIDPREHYESQERKKLEAHTNTFAMYANKWKELKRKQVKSETIEKQYRSLEKHLLEFIGDVPVQEIKPKGIVDLLTPIANKGSLETVKRLCRIVNEIMRIAVANGAIDVNYLTDITKLFPAPRRQNMKTLNPSELPDLMLALANASIMRTTRLLVEFQLHTITRPIEAATARWQDIDFENGVWTIPAERMKMNREHKIPLSSQVIKLLNKALLISSNREFVFPSHRNPNKHANSQSANMALKRMGFKGKLVSHGLRALASTTLNEQGFNPDLIESALAHVDKNEIRRAYNRAEYLEQRRELMNWWSSHIEKSSIGQLSAAM